MSRGTHQLGTVLNQALQTAAAEGRELDSLNPEHCMQLCMLRMHARPRTPGNAYLNGGKLIRGEIVLGPLATRLDAPSMEGLTRFMYTDRLVYRPPARGVGTPEQPKSCVLEAPSLTITARMRTECPACHRRRTDVWMDDLLQRTVLEANQPKPLHWSPELRVKCDCGCHPLSAWKFSSRVFPKNSYDDLVFNDQDREELLPQMLEAWKAGPPADGKPSLVLPRLWAVYRLSDRPSTAWEASTAAEKALEAHAYKNVYKGEHKPLGILPYEWAMEYHQAPQPLSQGLLLFWLEAQPLSIGWVPQKLLDDAVEETGWHRELRK